MAFTYTLIYYSGKKYNLSQTPIQKIVMEGLPATKQSR